MKIEKNIPMPETRKTKYNWQDMEVGDSVFFAAKKTQIYKEGASAHSWGRSNNVKFTVRSVEGGVRIWRTK